MRRSTSRITKLPGEVREEINRKMDAGWEYREIRKWLFEEVAGCDVPALGLVKGEKFGLVWLRSGKSMEHAWHHCELALGNWFRVHHPQWVKQQVQGSESMRVVRRAAALTHVASNRVASSRGAEPTPTPPGMGPDGTSGTRRPQAGTLAPPDQEGDEVISVSGGDVIMRSVLIDAVSTIKGGSSDPKDIAQLANAWARLNAGKMEAEKLKLKAEEALIAGLRAVKDQIKALPEALELFYKMTDVIEREMAKADPLAK